MSKESKIYLDMVWYGMGWVTKLTISLQAVTKRLREVMPKVYAGVSTDQLTFSSNRAFEANNAQIINGKISLIKTL